MANLSNIIEQFILSAIEEADKIEIGRNDLASHFAVSPSQINYVLSTRFTADRGYIVESRRGGGGCIIITKIKDNCLDYLDNILGDKQTISYKSGIQILDRLLNNNLITQNEALLIKSAISDKALKNPFQMSDLIRLQIIKQLLIEIMNRGEI